MFKSVLRNISIRNRGPEIDLCGTPEKFSIIRKKLAESTARGIQEVTV